MGKYDEKDTCWHILTVTRGGKVSMIKNLDAPTARQSYRRLRPDRHPKEYINIPESGSWTRNSISHCSDSDIEKVDIIGPEGCELKPWEGVKPHIIDLAPERDRQKACKKEQDRLDALAKKKADGLGILEELSPQISKRGFRCSQCSQMQTAESLITYVPDVVQRGDDTESVRDAVDANKWNGHSSGWCVKCVPKEPKAHLLSSLWTG